MGNLNSTIRKEYPELVQASERLVRKDIARAKAAHKEPPPTDYDELLNLEGTTYCGLMIMQMGAQCRALSIYADDPKALWDWAFLEACVIYYG